MSRVNLVLLLALMASCFWLVQSSHESRRVFVALERAQKQERILHEARDRLQLDRRAQATPLRVEKLARDKLKMSAATPAVTYYISTADMPTVPHPDAGGGP